MVLIDYLRYIWCYKSGRSGAHDFPQFSCEVVSLNVSVYMLTFGIITIIGGVVVREVSAPITEPSSSTMNNMAYDIGTIVLLFGSICVWFGFILLGCAIVRFNCSQRHLSANRNNALFSISNNNYIEMNSSTTLANDDFNWTLERPPPYTPNSD